MAAALWFGSQAVTAGTLDPRFLAVLALTPLALHEVLNTFAQAAQTYTRSRSALDRLSEVLDADPIGTGDVTSGDGTPGLALADVTVGWPGGGIVREDLMTVAPGERVALVGPSGSARRRSLPPRWV